MTQSFLSVAYTETFLSLRKVSQIPQIWTPLDRFHNKSHFLPEWASYIRLSYIYSFLPHLWQTRKYRFYQHNPQSNTSLVLISASTLLSLLLNIYSSLQNQSGCKVTNLVRLYRFMLSSHVDFFPVKTPLGCRSTEDCCCGQLSFYIGTDTGCFLLRQSFLPFAENATVGFNQPSYCVNVLGLVHSCVQYA